MPSSALLEKVAEAPSTAGGFNPAMEIHPDALVRLAIAQDPFTPSFLLERLAYDDDRAVLAAVLQHPNCTHDAMATILW